MSVLVEKFMGLPRPEKNSLVLAALALACTGFLVFAQVCVSFSLVFTLIVDPNDDTGPENKLFNYNLWEGVYQLWVNGAYALSIIVGLFSGIWPYIKLFAIMASAAKIRFSSKYLQEKVAKMMFVLGKWSLLDVWFVYAAVALVKFDVRGPMYRIILVGMSEIGVYLFFLSTFCAQILSYLHWRNYRLIEKLSREEGDAINRRASLSSTAYDGRENSLRPTNEGPRLSLSSPPEVSQSELNLYSSSEYPTGHEKVDSTQRVSESEKNHLRLHIPSEDQSQSQSQSQENTIPNSLASSSSVIPPVYGSQQSGRGIEGHQLDEDQQQIVRQRRLSLRGIDSRTFRASLFLLIVTTIFGLSCFMDLFAIDASIAQIDVPKKTYNLLQVFFQGLKHESRNVILGAIASIMIGVFGILFYISLWIFCLITVMLELGVFAPSRGFSQTYMTCKRVVKGLGYISSLEVLLFALFVVLLELPTIMKHAGQDIVDVRIMTGPGALIFGASIFILTLSIYPCLHYISEPKMESSEIEAGFLHGIRSSQNHNFLSPELTQGNLFQYQLNTQSVPRVNTAQPIAMRANEDGTHEIGESPTLRIDSLGFSTGVTSGRVTPRSRVSGTGSSGLNPRAGDSKTSQHSPKLASSPVSRSSRRSASRKSSSRAAITIPPEIPQRPKSTANTVEDPPQYGISGVSSPTPAKKNISNEAKYDEEQ